MDSGQQMRYSKDEIELIKKFVTSREDSLILLRNHFLQLPLTDEQKSFLQGQSADFVAVLVKTVAPDLDANVPLGQEATLFNRLTTLETVQPEASFLHIAANDIIIAYLEQQFAALSQTTEPTIVLQDLKKPIGSDQSEIRLVNLIAYNNIIPLVEGRLLILNALNNKKEETPEEAAKRLKANSSK